MIDYIYKGQPYNKHRFQVGVVKGEKYLVSEGITCKYYFFHDPDTFDVIKCEPIHHSELVLLKDIMPKELFTL